MKTINTPIIENSETSPFNKVSFGSIMTFIVITALAVTAYHFYLLSEANKQNLKFIIDGAARE